MHDRSGLTGISKGEGEKEIRNIKGGRKKKGKKGRKAKKAAKLGENN